MILLLSIAMFAEKSGKHSTYEEHVGIRKVNKQIVHIYIFDSQFHVHKQKLEERYLHIGILTKLTMRMPYNTIVNS